MFDEKNYGLVPLAEDGGDDEQKRTAQLSGIADFLASAYDPDAAKRTKERYGEVPDVTNESDRRYWAGVAFARACGVPDNPEACWLSNGHDIPEGAETREQMFEALGGEMDVAQKSEWDKRQATIAEASALAVDLMPAIVQGGDDTHLGSNPNWQRFFAAKERGLFTDEQEQSVLRATRAFGMFSSMVRHYNNAEANVLTDKSVADAMLSNLQDDETATALFFSAVQSYVQQKKAGEDEKGLFTRFGNAYRASSNTMTAQVMGGHFHDALSDEEVDEFYAIGRDLEKNPPEYKNEFYVDPRIERRNALTLIAKDSGQLLDDGSIRKLSKQEYEAWQKNTNFRADLYKAVGGMYEDKGAWYKNAPHALGSMLPQSLVYLVPYAGPAASWGASYTDQLVNDLAADDKGARHDFRSAQHRAVAMATIQTAVEKIAYGSIAKPVTGLNRIMSSKLVAPLLGRAYGTATGRFLISNAVGYAEESFAEPAAQLCLQGLYNAAADESNRLDPAWDDFKENISEMCKGENITATILYGLMLNGISVGAHRQGAKDYNAHVSALIKAGVPENQARAATTRREQTGNADLEGRALKEAYDKHLADGKTPMEAMAAMGVDGARHIVTAANDFAALHADLMPRVEYAGVAKDGSAQYRLFYPKWMLGLDDAEADTDAQKKGVLMNEAAMVSAVNRAVAELSTDDVAAVQKALIDNIKADSGIILREMPEGERMNAAYFRKIAERAKEAMKNGKGAEDIDEAVDPDIPLGQLAALGDSWQQRVDMYIASTEGKQARKAYEEEHGELSDEEWRSHVEEKGHSNINRQRVRVGDNAYKTVFRIASGEVTFGQVWEDYVEEQVDRDLDAHPLDFYIRGLQAVQAATGENLLGAAPAGGYERFHVIEGLGKLVRSKVLADTVARRDSLPAWLNSFLDIIRRWLGDCAALFRFGQAVNRALKEDRLKLEPEFRQMLDELVLKNTERLAALSVDSSAHIMQGAAAKAAMAAAAPAMKEAGLTPAEGRTPTPILDAAEEAHGAEVRAEQKAKDEAHDKLVEDIGYAMAQEPGAENAQEPAGAPAASVAANEPTETHSSATDAPEGVSASVSTESPEVDAATSDPALRQAGYDEVAAGASPGEAVRFVQALAALRQREPGKEQRKFKRNERRKQLAAMGGRFPQKMLEHARRMAKFVQRVHDAAGKRAARAMQKGDADAFARWSREKAAWEGGAWVANPARVAEAAAWDGKATITTTLHADSGFSASFGMDDADYEKQLADIKARAIADGTFMKAPNGKATNLTERQWLQVRTPQFIAWFGDWLRASELTFDESELSDEETVAKLLEIKGELVNDETGIRASANRKQRDKITSQKAHSKSLYNGFSRGVHNNVASRLPVLFRHAVFLAEYKDAEDSPNILSIKRFATPIMVKNERCFALLTVKETKLNGHKLYSVELDKIEKLETQVNRLEENKRSSVSSKDIVEKVNQAVKDYFGNNSKVLDENGEPLVVYHYTNYEGNILRTTNEEGYGATHFYTSNRDNKASDAQKLYYGSREIAAFLNVRHPVMVDANGSMYDSIPYNGKMCDTYGIAKAAREKDADGVIITNVREFGGSDMGTDWLAFNPNQIKSATDNSGPFSSASADITHSFTVDQSALLGRLTDEEAIAAGANTEYTAQMLREMKSCMERIRSFRGASASEREQALVAIGEVHHLARAATAFLPKGYRVNVRPYLNSLQALAELSQSGDIDFTKGLASQDLQRFVASVRKRLERHGLDAVEGILDTKRMEGYEPGEDVRVEDLLKDYAGKKVVSIMDDLVAKVSEQLRRHAKDDVIRRMTKLIESARVRRDRNKVARGRMSADAYRQLDSVIEALGMTEEEVQAKLAELDAKQDAAETESERDLIDDERIILNTFGNLKGMSYKDAQDAYDALYTMLKFSRLEWEDKIADRTLARRSVIHKVVSGLGLASDNEFHDARLRRPPMYRLKNVFDILANMPQVLRAMRGHLALRDFAGEIAKRINEAGERKKKLERERFLALEELSRNTLGMSWRDSMDYMHAQHDTGIAFDSPVWRKVSIKTDFLRELLAMEPDERRAYLDTIRKQGGAAALNLPSEADLRAAADKLDEYDSEGVEHAAVETRYIERYNHTDSLHLSRGEALYAVLMFEQPTYTERLIAQGYTFDVIEKLKDFINEETDMLAFGYGLRELFAAQGERLRVVYEEEYGIPWPQEENYFAAKWIVPDKEQRDPAQALCSAMAGTAGSGKDFLKRRVDHNLRLDTNCDALQVFLQATSLSDHWLCTQAVVGDLRNYMRDEEFDRAMTVTLGKEEYQNFKDWVNILDMGGAQDCVNMGVAQDVVSGIYGSGAVALLGLNLRTLIRQTPAVLNGLLGAPDISTTEWLRSFRAHRDGTAPMTIKKMLNSDFIKGRKSGHIGTMKGQAMRSGLEKSSKVEGFLEFAMNPMEDLDAFWTAVSLVPVYNAYYYRALDKGASEQEANAAAWEQTAMSGNLASQGIGLLNKAKVAQIKNPVVRGVFYMLSEDMGKTALCVNLWKGGHKKAALRAWFYYGAANAIISAILDALTGDPDEWEDDGFWKKVAEYALSAVYGPLASLPLAGEAVSGIVNAGIHFAGDVTGWEGARKFNTKTSVGRTLIDVTGAWRACEKIYNIITDDKDHHWSEYVSAISQISRVSAFATGWTRSMFGYASLVAAVILNPISFTARFERNAEHWAGWD